MTTKCQNPPEFKRYWPGRAPDFVCGDHALDSKRIADAMGFFLYVEPCVPADPDATCCCSPGFSQSVTTGPEQ